MAVCQFDRLERRAYLFASLSSTGTLHVVGDAAGNAIVVDVTGAQAVATLDANAMTFAGAQVRRVKVEGDAGNDSITIFGPRTAMLSGGAGDDTLVGGTGSDFLAGGDGFDTADYRDRPTAFEFFIDSFVPGVTEPEPEPTEGLGMGVATNATGERDKIGFYVEAIVGTEAADRFSIGGTGGRDPRLDGRGGDDEFALSQEVRSGATMVGGDGNDFFVMSEYPWATVYGGAGDVEVYVEPLASLPAAFEGGDGRDTLDLGGYDNDVDLRAYPDVEDAVAGHSFSMTVTGNDLPNRLTASTEGYRVTLVGLGGDDTLTGGGDNDRLEGDDGDDLLGGAGGNDYLRGEAGNDTLGGGSGVDRLYGDSGNDYLAGHSSRDRLYGGAGVDTFAGGSGNDLFYARDGIAEVLYGASGRDASQLDEGAGRTLQRRRPARLTGARRAALRAHRGTRSSPKRAISFNEGRLSFCPFGGAAGFRRAPLRRHSHTASRFVPSSLTTISHTFHGSRRYASTS